MEIMIGKDYKITSDPLNVILNKRYVQKDKEGNVIDENAFKQIGFYPNLTSACVGLLTKGVNGSDAETVEGLKEYIAAVEKSIVAAVNK